MRQLNVRVVDHLQNDLATCKGLGGRPKELLLLTNHLCHDERVRLALVLPVGDRMDGGRSERGLRRQFVLLPVLDSSVRQTLVVQN